MRFSQRVSANNSVSVYVDVNALASLCICLILVVLENVFQ